MKRTYIRSLLVFVFASLFLTFSFVSTPAKAAAAATEAPSTHKAVLTTNRAAGTANYTVTGLDLASDTALTINAVNSSTKKTAFTKNVTLDETNCKEGTFTGNITLADLKYAFANYTVTVTIGTKTLTAGTADFTIHTAKAGLSITGNTGAAVRTAAFVSKEATGGVLVPGTGNQISIQIWNKNRAESTAVTVGKAMGLNANQNWSVDVSKSGNYYGKWGAKAVVTNSNWKTQYTLASTEYNVVPSCTSFVTKKTKALEKKKAFAIQLSGLTNVFGVNGVTFQVFNSDGRQVATLSGKKKTASYYKEVTMKTLKYNLDLFTIKAVVIDSNNKTYTLAQTTKADQRMKKGTLTVTKKKNATCIYKLSGAYVPGNIKKVEFDIYRIKNGKKKKLGTYKAKASSNKKTYTVTVKNEAKGTYEVRAFATSAWKSRLLLKKKKFKLKKSDLGKNGWYYEKYKGKKYKFYYINNEKQTDLTKILKLKKSSSSHQNKFYIEVNRAACVVTIYMYNDETNKYDIPVKTCSVCVGSDIWTVAGTGGLHEKSAYTPIGTYSVCTNGQSVKYTMKPMHEPDGSTVYARWATHIVGNVYFHSIAVGTQSHYALPAVTYNKLGRPASAGCIRMAVADAKWIYDYTSTGNTIKIVKGSTKKPGPLGKAKTIKVKGGINYDPTDPGVPDSRKKKDYKAKRISGYLTKKGKKSDTKKDKRKAVNW